LLTNEKIEKIMRVVEAIRIVVTSSTDPFNVDVKGQLETLKKFLPGWTDLDEILLDIEALNLLSRVVELQEKWVRYQASSLYVDPLLVELKIVASTPERLAEVFSGSWHPIVKVEQLSMRELARAANYWNNLLPLGGRFKEEFGEEKNPNSLNAKDLVKMRIITEEELKKRIVQIYEELSFMLEQKEKIDYWEFVYKEDLDVAIERAVLLSHIVSSGYASIEMKPLEEKILITKPKASKLPKSVAIAISLSKKGDKIEQ